MRSLIFLTFLLTGCGAASLTAAKSTFRIRMYGTFTPATGAEGNQGPASIVFSFISMTLTSGDSGADVILDNGAVTDVKIIDRAQSIYINEDMTDYEGRTFSNAVVHFSSDIKINPLAGDQTAKSMTTGDFSVNEVFTIEKAKERVLSIKVAWGKTVAFDEATTPSVTNVYAPTLTTSFK